MSRIASLRSALASPTASGTGTRLTLALIKRRFYLDWISSEGTRRVRSVRELHRQREQERLYAEGYYDHIIGW